MCSLLSFDSWTNFNVLTYHSDYVGKESYWSPATRDFLCVPGQLSIKCNSNTYANEIHLVSNETSNDTSSNQ